MRKSTAVLVFTSASAKSRTSKFSVKSKDDNSSLSKEEEVYEKIMDESKFNQNGDLEFEDIAISQEVITEERNCIIDKVNFQMSREFKTWVYLDGNTLTKSEVIRRVGNEGMFSKMMDIFLNGKNIWHKVTHSLEDEKELDQFHRNWTKNWSNKGPNEK